MLIAKVDLSSALQQPSSDRCVIVLSGVMQS